MYEINFRRNEILFAKGKNNSEKRLTVLTIFFSYTNDGESSKITVIDEYLHKKKVKDFAQRFRLPFRYTSRRCKIKDRITIKLGISRNATTNRFKSPFTTTAPSTDLEFFKEIH